MQTRLKICGITGDTDALACADLGVHFLGFNFYPQSPRYIALQRAREIIGQLPLTSAAVGILVRPTLDEILRVIEITHISAVQLYDPVDCDDFSQLPVPVIVAVHASNENLTSTHWRGANMILLDAFAGHKLGGAGQKFDWTIIPQAIPRERLILAGGINPENIAAALEQVRPAMVDVASGAEISAGQKDIEKIRRMMKILFEFNLRWS